MKNISVKCCKECIVQSMCIAKQPISLFVKHSIDFTNFYDIRYRSYWGHNALDNCYKCLIMFEEVRNKVLNIITRSSFKKVLPKKHKFVLKHLSSRVPPQRYTLYEETHSFKFVQGLWFNSIFSTEPLMFQICLKYMKEFEMYVVILKDIKSSLGITFATGILKRIT